MATSARPPKLAYPTYLEAIATNAASLSSLLRAMPPTARVPSCPDWSMSDLGAHVGDFAAFYSHAVSESTGAARPPWPNTWRAGGSSPLGGVPAARHFDQRVNFLLAVLRATPPDARVPTWHSDDQTAHFVARRAAHEIAIHRVDAEIAAGARGVIDPGIAVDGIEEVLLMVEVFNQRSGVGGTGQTLHLQAIDVQADWLLRLGERDLVVTRERTSADLNLIGAASDIELLLYGRPTHEAVKRVGSNAVLDVWYRAFTF
jgi:uncharacterized protein (TIGR03083 family)